MNDQMLMLIAFVAGALCLLALFLTLNSMGW